MLSRYAYRLFSCTRATFRCRFDEDVLQPFSRCLVYSGSSSSHSWRICSWEMWFWHFDVHLHVKKYPVIILKYNCIHPNVLPFKIRKKTCVFSCKCVKLISNFLAYLYSFVATIFSFLFCEKTIRIPTICSS